VKISPREIDVGAGARSLLQHRRVARNHPRRQFDEPGQLGQHVTDPKQAVLPDDEPVSPDVHGALHAARNEALPRGTIEGTWRARMVT